MTTAAGWSSFTAQRFTPGAERRPYTLHFILDTSRQALSADVHIVANLLPVALIVDWRWLAATAGIGPRCCEHYAHFRDARLTHNAAGL